MKIPNDMISGARHQTGMCGELVVVEYKSCNRVDVIFANTGATRTAVAKIIRRGNVKDAMAPSVYGVGFIGSGSHRSRTKGIMNPAYACWHSMIERAYCEKYHAKRPTYADCTVVAEWHNFQVFAEWFEGNAVAGLELDKDILVDGNRVYGPEFCLFVTQRENMQKATARSYALVSPNGETHEGVNVSEFCRTHGLRQQDICGVLNGKLNQYKGWTATIED